MDLAVVTDAVPKIDHYVPETECINYSDLNLILNKFKTDDFKSLFFLLLDYISYEDFFTIITKDKHDLKEKFIEICKRKKFTEEYLIEIFVTLKHFEALRKLNICKHVCELPSQDFSRIGKFWKLLYSICEELTDSEWKLLQKKLFPNMKEDFFQSAEELLCFASRKEVISERNLKVLAKSLENKPVCLRLIYTFIEYSRSVEYYHLRKPSEVQHCGIAVIFDHSKFDDNSPLYLSERKGNNVDVESLTSLWKSYGFKTIVKVNLTDKEVMDTFENLAKMDHSCYDIFVACYLSHGCKDCIYASNNVAIPITSLINIMANNCPTLNNKPKLFFIQACQGTLIQQGVGAPPIYSDGTVPKVIVQNDKNCLEKKTPHFCDVLQVVSTYPGYVSIRSESKGSWFVSCFVEIMKDCGDKLPILDVMFKVTEEVSKKEVNLGNLKSCKQTVFTSSTLRKSLKLNKISY